MAPRSARRKSRQRARALGWTHPPFEIPQAIYEAWNARECGALLESTWNAKFAAYRAAHPARASEFQRRMAGDLPADFRAEGGGVRRRADPRRAKPSPRARPRSRRSRPTPSGFPR